MSYRILVVDYSETRGKHLVGRLRERLKDVDVSSLQTQPPDSTKAQDHTVLSQLKNPYDLVVAHIGGNPSGYECLRTFKEHNPTGKFVLFTRLEAVRVDKFEGLKLADAIFRRDEDENIVFKNDDAMLDLIARVRAAPAITSAVAAPEKVTIPWLLHNVPVTLWAAAGGIIVTVFAAGVTLGGNPVVQSLVGSKAASAPPAASATGK